MTTPSAPADDMNYAANPVGTSFDPPPAYSSAKIVSQPTQPVIINMCAAETECCDSRPTRCYAPSSCYSAPSIHCHRDHHEDVHGRRCCGILIGILLIIAAVIVIPIIIIQGNS